MPDSASITAIAWWTSDSIFVICLVNLLNRLLSRLTSTAFAVPNLDLVLEDLVGCTRRDGLVDRLAVAARAAIFNRVLLANAAAPATTRLFTRRFFARLLLDVIASCVTLGGSCSCTLGVDRVSLVIERVCLDVLLSRCQLPILSSRDGL